MAEFDVEIVYATPPPLPVPDPGLALATKAVVDANEAEEEASVIWALAILSSCDEEDDGPSVSFNLSEAEDEGDAPLRLHLLQPVPVHLSPKRAREEEKDSVRDEPDAKRPRL